MYAEYVSMSGCFPSTVRPIHEENRSVWSKFAECGLAHWTRLRSDILEHWHMTVSILNPSNKFKSREDPGNFFKNIRSEIFDQQFSIQNLSRNLRLHADLFGKPIEAKRRETKRNETIARKERTNERTNERNAGTKRMSSRANQFSHLMPF